MLTVRAMDKAKENSLRNWLSEEIEVTPLRVTKYVGVGLLVGGLFGWIAWRLFG